MSADTETQQDTARRNTKKSRAFMGTWNNFPSDYAEILKGFDKQVFQEEIGESGNHHIQFAVYCKNATSFESIRSKIPGAHIEVAKNWEACKQYCRKSDTAVEGTGFDSTSKKRAKDPLEGRQLLPIQSEIMHILDDEPDDRSIHWVVDLQGNSGKTTLAKSLCINRKDVIYLTGKSADMKYGVTKWLEKNDLKVILIDLARSQECYVSYQGIEEVKNGIFYNTKYESSMVVFDSPHVVVFANFEPDTEKLSADRWNIIRVQADETHLTQDTEDTACLGLEDELDKMFGTE